MDVLLAGSKAAMAACVQPNPVADAERNQPCFYLRLHRCSLIISIAIRLLACGVPKQRAITASARLLREGGVEPGVVA